MKSQLFVSFVGKQRHSKSLIKKTQSESFLELVYTAQRASYGTEVAISWSKTEESLPMVQ